jgi:formylglycine-generating enzyme required for sulfatase activity
MASPGTDQAREDWQKVRSYDRGHPRLTPTSAATLWKALDTFQERHGDTAFAASVRAEIAALREKLQPHLPKIKFDSKIRLSVCLFEGLDEFGTPCRDRFRKWHAKELGHTPTDAGTGIPIPAGGLCCIRPLRLDNPEGDLRRVAGEVKRWGIPGLDLSRKPHWKGPWANDKALAALRDLNHLRYLNLDFCKAVTDAGLGPLKNLGNLEYLTLAELGGNITDNGIARLTGLSRLTALGLQNCVLTDKCADSLVKLRRLRHVNLNYTHIGDEGLGKLAELPNLQSLELAFTDITDAGVGQVARMQALSHVRLPWQIGDDGVAHLSKMENLESVYCGAFGEKPKVPLTDTGVAHIARIPHLKRLDLVGARRITDAGLAHLSRLKQLSHLSLHGCEDITDAGLRHLEALPALEEVDLRGTKVTDQGKARLMAKLAENRQRAAKAESAAENAWKQISEYVHKRGVKQTTAKALSDALDRFDKKYGTTDFAVSITREIDALRVKLRGGAPPAIPDGPKTLNIDLGGGVKMEFVRIPAGTFMMGSNNGRGNEKPVHKVTITRPFYIGKYEVTQEQWQAVMGKNPSKFTGAKNPVEMLAWSHCQEFLEKLNQKVRGAKCTLPTEAEWEYACRGRSTTEYCFGDDEKGLGDYAWYRENSGRTTHAVGQKKPNARGLYDMHGNVWEWCQDWYDVSCYKAGRRVDPKGPRTGHQRVLRGGSWNGHAAHCRSAYRGNLTPTNRSDNLGFRVVLVGGGD